MQPLSRIRGWDIRRPEKRLGLPTIRRGHTHWGYSAISSHNSMTVKSTAQSTRDSALVRPSNSSDSVITALFSPSNNFYYSDCLSATTAIDDHSPGLHILNIWWFSLTLPSWLSFSSLDWDSHSSPSSTRFWYQTPLVGECRNSAAHRHRGCPVFFRDQYRFVGLRQWSQGSTIFLHSHAQGTAY